MDDICEHDQVSVDGKQDLIGVSDGDAEAIFVDGILGFALSIAASVSLIVGSVSGIPPIMELAGTSFATYGVPLFLSALVCALALRCGQVATDKIQTPKGKIVTVVLYMGSLAAAVAFSIAGLWIPAVLCAALGLTFTVFYYACFLARLTRRALMVVFNSAFLICGLGVAALVQFNPFISLATAVIAVAVSLTVGFIRARMSRDDAVYVTIEESRQRSVTLVGHNYTIFTIGFMLSPAVLAFTMDSTIEVTLFGLGAAIALAGIASMLLERVDERAYKEAFKKNMTVVAAIFLLATPIVASEWRVLVLSVYLLLVAINAIILLNAVVESARFDMISPIWLMGKDGSVFCAGAAVGCALFLLGSMFAQYGRVSMSVVCSLAVVVVAFAQVHINYQVYPFEPQIDPSESEKAHDEESRDLIERSGNHKRTYQRKREYACEVFKLSPREREILQLLLRGRDAKYIMSEFYISQSTAKTHIYNIYRKFEVHSRQELLDFIENIELPDDDPSQSE